MSDRCVVFLALITWRSLYQRPQQKVAHWPDDCPRVYVEPLVFQPGNAWLPERTEYGWRLSIPLLPHAAKSPLVKRLTGFIGDVPALRWLANGFARLWLATAWRIGGLPQAEAVVIESPQYRPLLANFPQARTLLDYMDDILEFEGIPGYFREELARLAAEVDQVVATSLPLAEKLQALADVEAEVIGNGVDLTHFRRTGGESPLPELQGRKIVYAGTVGYWIDLPLLEAVADACPEDTLCIFGPVYREVDEAFARLAARPNVYAPGTLPYAELPRHLEHCDVAVIPFLDTELTRAVNPNKAYEYAAMGLPFVARYLPPLEDFREAAPLVHDHKAFLASLRELLAEAAPQRNARLEALAAIAQANSWQSKVAAVAALLQDGKKWNHR